MVYYKEETKMKILDEKTVAGIEDTIVKKFDEAKAVSAEKNKVDKMRLFTDIAKELRDTGYYSEEEYSDCIVGIGNLLGFHYENFKK